jgi:hypothetical protein
MSEKNNKKQQKYVVSEKKQIYFSLELSDSLCTIQQMIAFFLWQKEGPFTSGSDHQICS